ncbi:tRNA-intron lyase [Candidatus Pacearchaeota archaeon]|nr:tRNA-intron lyase [Candidatus Pacearchaeota archaeon]
MEKIQAHIVGEIVSSNSSEAHTLYKKSVFGEPRSGKVQYTISEAIYLVEKGKMELTSRNKKIPKKELINKFKRIDKRIQIKYPVFKDLRERGYIVKTALKFGADFRVYPKGKKPGKSHAQWIVFADHESKILKWNEFSAKNRVAHSTKKKLLLAIVDEEGDITYYEVGWVRP